MNVSERVIVNVRENSTTALKIGFNMKEIQLAAFDLQTATQKVDVDSVKADSSVATTLKKSLAVMLVCTIDDANFVPTATEFESSEITEATADQFIGRCIIFTTGDLIYQAAWIEDYALSSGKGHLTVSALVAAPADGDEFLLI